jgi:hypothetical protein
MHLEPLTRLVESADFVAFREIAMRYLSLKGYRDVEVKDGWNDGGSDFAVGVLGANPVPLAIQVTVQRSGWQAKVKADCRRAKTELGLANALYVTSRRLARVDFTKVADELWERDGITVRPVDSQSIASAFFEQDETSFILSSLGISLDARRPDPVPRPDLKEDAAYSFAFFGEASDRFRTSVVEQTILSHLTRPRSSAEREATELAAAEALQLQGDQQVIVASAIDRMLQAGRLRVVDGSLAVDAHVVEAFRAMRALREGQWQALAREINNYLVGAGLTGAGLQRASAAVMESAGALFMGAATSVSAAVGMAHDPGPIRFQLRKRLRELSAALAAAGISEGMLDTRLNELAQIASRSEIGRVLMAGELFVSLASMNTNAFERAFGATAGTEIYLDASVAIPMIASLLYAPASQRFSQAAYRVFELSRRRGLSLVLPRVYLEEAASHLIEAHERYQPLLGIDDDLRYSTNAFVAHYSDLAARGELQGSFSRYADGLGYVRRNTSFGRQRDAVMDTMAAHFKRYGITVVECVPLDKTAITYAQEAVAFTAHELRINRTGRLLEHDASVVAYFIDSDAASDCARVFCTWDRLHLRLQTAAGRARWQVLDPPMLGDVLLLTRPDDVGELMTTVDIAMELSEEESERGAAVLDTLVRIEREALHDAELLNMARQFKDAYMQALRDSAAPEDMAEAWAKWKGGNRELVRQATLPV